MRESPDAYKHEDGSTEIHQALDGGLVKGIIHGIGVLIIAMLANPGGVPIFDWALGASTTDKLELCGIELIKRQRSLAERTFPYV